MADLNVVCIKLWAHTISRTGQIVLYVAYYVTQCKSHCFNVTLVTGNIKCVLCFLATSYMHQARSNTVSLVGLPCSGCLCVRWGRSWLISWGHLILERKVVFWSERSSCAALGCWHKRSWPKYLALFFFLSSSSLRGPYFSTRKKAARVTKFCKGS